MPQPGTLQQPLDANEHALRAGRGRYLWAPFLVPGRLSKPQGLCMAPGDREF